VVSRGVGQRQWAGSGRCRRWRASQCLDLQLRRREESAQYRRWPWGHDWQRVARRPAGAGISASRRAWPEPVVAAGRARDPAPPRPGRVKTRFSRLREPRTPRAKRLEDDAHFSSTSSWLGLAAAPAAMPSEGTSTRLVTTAAAVAARVAPARFATVLVTTCVYVALFPVGVGVTPL
jgi:hypothetical protein